VGGVGPVGVVVLAPVLDQDLGFEADSSMPPRLNRRVATAVHQSYSCPFHADTKIGQRCKWRRWSGGASSHQQPPAKPFTGTMEFDGQITSVKQQGKQCRYTANLIVAVATTAIGSPDGFTGQVRALWTDECGLVEDPAISGTADVRLNVSGSAGANPEGFRFRGVSGRA
jgi:hypothetical protein